MDSHAVPVLAIFEKSSALRFLCFNVSTSGVKRNNGNRYGRTL